MLRVDAVDVHTKQRAHVSFFSDDTIETVRQRIGIVADVHPDRLFILVKVRKPQTHYAADPRNWEALFTRLSYGTKTILQAPFQTYTTELLQPTQTFVYQPYGYEEWMNVPDSLSAMYEPSATFSEYMIFGVKEKRSYSLPLEYTSNEDTGKIAAADYPIPQQSTLVSSLYNTDDIQEFLYIPHDASNTVVNPIVYFPFLRDSTPPRISSEAATALQTSTRRIQDILDLPAPEPDVNITRVRFRVPWVDTEFGSAVRTRFEQIFYGFTVSEESPYIGFFTSNDETARHKFHAKQKTPTLDLSWWKSWWTATKLVRSRPTLVLYRGTSPQNFDRIAITSVDMIVSSYRKEGNKTKTIETFQQELADWVDSLDAIRPFLDTKDLQPSRWELQDTTIAAKYSSKLDEYDLRRFSCLSSIFDVADKDTSTFRLLRADVVNDKLGAMSSRILQILKDRPNATSTELQEELDISIEDAQELREDPDLMRKLFRGFPTVKSGQTTTTISSTTRPLRVLQYANALRFVLSDAPEVDKVCPRRVEQVGSARAHIGGADPEDDEYADWWADAPEEEEAPAAVEEEKEKEAVPSIAEEEEAAPVTAAPVTVKVKTGRKKKMYNYFNERLQTFDPDTFNPKNSEYPKKCEHEHQPIILSSAQLDAIQATHGAQYDPRTYFVSDESQKRLIEYKDPDGLIMCPDYWCMKDEVPLQESQLVDGKCPICGLGIQQKATDDPREFPVVSRDKARKYPGFGKYVSPTNGRPVPCCYKMPEKIKLGESPTDDKYYILGETKESIPPLRLAFLPQDVLDALMIDETYTSFKGTEKRIQSPMSGFFRVGLGRPSEYLPKLLGVQVEIPKPHENPDATLKCSFVTTWTTKSDTHVPAILNKKQIDESVAKTVSGISDAYENGHLTPLQELEYVCVVLQCDVFRMFMDSKTMGCTFYTPIVRPRKSAVIVLQTGNTLDVLAHVRRLPKSIRFSANVYGPESAFKKDTVTELERMKNAACATSVPSYDTALNAMRDILTDLNEPDFSIITDPFGRAQAFYVAEKVILPFQSAPLPDTTQAKVSGYDTVVPPTYGEAIAYLKTASKYSTGYNWKEDATNMAGERVEVILQSGLRVPVMPEPVNDSNVKEVIQTTQTIGESELAFGKEDEEMRANYEDISYASEVFDFLMFSLSKDLVAFPDLRTALQTPQPVRTDVRPLLKQWFEYRTWFTDIEKAPVFVTKVRNVCGPPPSDIPDVVEEEPEPVPEPVQEDVNVPVEEPVPAPVPVANPCPPGKIQNPATKRCVKETGAIAKKVKKQQGGSERECKGALCGWNGSTCRIKVNDKLDKSMLFNRLLSTLISNAKLRAVILDGRNTPFFSTILYLQLPHELVLTDIELDKLIT